MTCSCRTVCFYLMIQFGIFISIKSQCSLDAPEDVNQVFVDESTLPGSVIFNFTKSGTITTASITATDPKEYLEIDPSAGTLKLIKKYDYESRTNHFFNIPVPEIKYSCGSGEETFQKTIIIIFKDADDIEPKWTPAAVFYTGSIKESAGINSLVKLDQNLKLEDSELGNNIQDIKVTILSGPNSEYFSLESATSTIPEIQLQKPLDYDNIQQINLTLNVEDIERSTQQSKFNVTCLVVVNIGDEDVKPPKFDHTSYSGNITATATKDTEVNLSPAALVAKDQDLINSQEIVYSIQFQSKENAFRISSTNGKVFLNIDNIPVFEYKLVVKAVEVNDSTKSATVEVSINVVTDPAVMPIFSPDSYSSSVREDASSNSEIVKFVTSPSDSSLVYTVQSFDQFFYTGLKAGSTYLLLKSPVDYENTNQRQFNVSIKATKDSKNIFATVIVTVLDVNDNTPTFKQESYSFNATQRVVGYVVGQVEATDLDLDNRITYSLVNSVNSQFFTISSDNGQIKIAKETTKAEYSITAEAKDSGTPQRTKNVNIVIKFDPIESITTPVNSAGISLIPLVPILAVVAVVAIVVCVVIIVCYKKRMRAKADAQGALANLESSRLSLTDHWATSTQANPLSGFPIGREFENGSYLGDIYSSDRDIGEIQLNETYETLPTLANGFHGKNGSIRTMSTASVGSHPKHSNSHFPQKLGVAPNGIEVLKAENAIDTGSNKDSDKVHDLNIYY